MSRAVTIPSASFRPGRVLAAAMLGYGSAQVGMTTISATLPAFATLYGSALDQVAWLLTAYLLGMTALVLPAGRLGDRFGHARIYRAGTVAFVLTSAACAWAPGLMWLWILRGLQGAAGAFMLTAAFPLVTNAYPASYRGRVVSMVTLASSLGSVLGIYVATRVVQWAPPAWIFTFVIPPGLLGLLLLPRPAAWTADRGGEKLGRAAVRGPVDWLGVALLAAGLVAFSLSLNHLHAGPETFGDGWGWHLPMHLLSLVLLAIFVWHEWRVKDPILPLRYLKNKAFVAALLANVALHLAMMGSSTTLPFVIQIGMGLPPTYTAYALTLVQLMGLVLLAPSGYLVDRGGGRFLMPVGLLLMMSVLLTFGWVTAGISYAGLVGVAAFLGVAMGMSLAANNPALMGSVPPELRGFASGMLETTRQMGHGLAATLVGSLLSDGLVVMQRTGVDTVFHRGLRESWWLLGLIAAAGLAACLWHLVEKQRAGAANIDPVARAAAAPGAFR